MKLLPLNSLRFVGVLAMVVSCQTTDSRTTALPASYHRLSDRISCSAEPVGAKTFAALAKEGVKTIVSVDGAVPDVKEAERHGLRYVHLPIGYDGMPKATVVSLNNLLKEDSGRILIHCHHGKHRGPTAAVIACMIEGTMTRAKALQTLHAVGTGAEYPGLWRDVRSFTSVPQNVAAAPLKSKADMDPFTADMVAIDHAFDALTKSNHLNRETTTLLVEGFTEAVRHTPGKFENRTEFSKALNHAKKESIDLKSAVASDGPDALKAKLSALKNACTQCHQRFRN